MCLARSLGRDPCCRIPLVATLFQEMQLWKFGPWRSVRWGASLAGRSQLFWGGGGGETGGLVGCADESGPGSAFFLWGREGEPDPGDKQIDQLGQCWVCQSRPMACASLGNLWCVRGCHINSQRVTHTRSAHLWEQHRREGLRFLEHLLGAGSPAHSVQGEALSPFTGRHWS